MMIKPCLATSGVFKTSSYRERTLPNTLLNIAQLCHHNIYDDSSLDLSLHILLAEIMVAFLDYSSNVHTFLVLQDAEV